MDVVIFLLIKIIIRYITYLSLVTSVATNNFLQMLTFLHETPSPAANLQSVRPHVIVTLLLTKYLNQL